MLGNVFFSAASVAYYGPFTGTFRDMIVENWITRAKEIDIPFAETYTLQNILGNPI